MIDLLSLIAKAVEVSDKLKDVELKELLVKARLEAVSLADENVRLRKENLELREASRDREEMYFEDNYWWRKRADGSREGPFCPRCWEGNQKPVRMLDRGPSFDLSC